MMTNYIIPFRDFAAFAEEVTIELTPFRFRFFWNTRAKFWSMSIYDREGNLLISGVRLVINYELLRWYPGRGLPTGKLFVIDLTESKNPIGRYDFVNERQLRLVYIGDE